MVMSSIEVVPIVPEFDSRYCLQAYNLIKHEIFSGDRDFPRFNIQVQIMQEQCKMLYGIVLEHRTSLAAVGALGRGVLEGYREVAYLATEQKSRGRGYGGYLLGLLEKVAAKEGASGTYLIPNGDTVKFYENRGYCEWTEAPIADDVWHKQFEGVVRAK